MGAGRKTSLNMRGKWPRKANRYNPNAPDWRAVHLPRWPRPFLTAR